MPRVMLLASAESIHTLRWANAIAARGWHVDLVSLHRLKGQLDANVALHMAPRPPLGGYFTNCFWLRRLIARRKPVLLHAHYASGYGTLGALSGFHPFILSVWGSDIYDFPAASFVKRRLIRRNLACADKILSTSHAMARHTSKFTTKPIEVTPFGVDLGLFCPQTVDGPFGKDDVVIGTVKTLDVKYGIGYLIEAFRELMLKRPDLPLKLLIIGGGPLETELKARVAAAGLAGVAKFTGFVRHEEIPRYHNMLTISVFPSIMDSESFGVSVIEASACGKPVVAASVGGLPEVVDDSVTGMVVPPRDVAATAQALERLATDKSLRDYFGSNGRKKVQALYNWHDNVSQMMDIYAALC